MIGQIFSAIFYQPMFNLLIFFYNVIPGHDIGVAILLLTIVIKLILYPLSVQSIRSQKAMQTLQPKIDELKKKYKDEKEKMASELMALYKQEKVNPLSSCLPLLIQLPFLIAVYQVFRNGLSSHGLNLLYPFVANPGTINTLSLGFVDLLKPNIILAILAAAAQFFQTKMIQVNRPPKDKTGQVPAGAKDEDMMAIMNKQMLYFMPLMTVFIGASLPGGLTFYWFLTTVLTVLQQWWMFRKKKDNDTPGQEIIKSV